MNKIIISLIVVLAISIGVNVWFLSGKGIVVNNYTTNHQEQYQQQWQGQLLLNQWTAQGDKIEWKSIIMNAQSPENEAKRITEELNKLHPISAFYSRVYYHSSRCSIIFYPDIFQSKK